MNDYTFKALWHLVLAFMTGISMCMDTPKLLRILCGILAILNIVLAVVFYAQAI